MENDPLAPNECAERLSALAAPERLRIIQILRSGPRNATELSELLDTAPVNVSHHVKVLKGAGLIQSRKQGRFVYFSLTPGICIDDGESARLNLGCCKLELPSSGQAEAD
ncbi:MAG: ArsR/SmtB family transcription factor [Gemmataceae bacterium]